MDLTAENDAGEVRFLAGSHAVAVIYVAEPEASFVAAQWRQVARSTNVTEKLSAKRLINRLLELRRTENAALRDQVIAIDGDILALDPEIASAEGEMNQLVYKLYGLTEDEIRLVEAG